MAFNISSAVSVALLASVFGACADKKESSTPTVPYNSTEPSTLQGKSFVTVGQLAIGSFGLTATNPVTHVIAYNPETGKTKIAKVSAEDKFELALASKLKSVAEYTKADGTIDRNTLAGDGFATVEEMSAYTDAQIIEGLTSELEEKAESGKEGTPWIVTYVNKDKTGAEMVVSRFGSETLDTLAPSPESTKTLDLGTVTPVAGARAESTANYQAVLDSTGISTEAAKTLGEIDTVSLRYANPDIDNSGKFDADEGKTFALDFHNRFNWSTIDGGAAIQSADMKNKFPDEVAGGTSNLKVSYTGTGIIPELEKTEFSAAPSAYTWKFDFADSTSAVVDLNNSDSCNEGGITVANGANCTQAFTVDPTYSRYQMRIEVKTPPEGTYTLTTGGKTFTWTNVEVSDFSAGNGFLALMVSWTVDEKGTAGDDTDDRLTGFKYKYMKKDATAGWVAASQEELDLIVKGSSSRIGFKIQGSQMSCGWRAAKVPSGTVVFADTNVDDACEQNPDTTLKADIKSVGLLWSSFYNAGVSYDDKLGMRFFF